ncbi:zf-RVT domain-containing protein [Cephalotus follicularis]|uniref:Zf-RVT domain-containing protein n=1 Tax=Cephalotus follicularis TaxID=3775 RepID=A0A1Q3CRY2_CEPFO|nr:zf-RVT domain-containing protein [Cephalotus follicularis]
MGQAFSTQKAWQAIRPQSAQVNWFQVVWHPNRIPKHAFCLWLSILGAHKTRDKLMPLGIVDTASCIFNCGDNENVAHLFIACTYSRYVWRKVLSFCDIFRSPLPWLDEIQWMADHSRVKALPQKLRKLAFGATIYHIWMERNRRCFRNTFLPPEDVIRKIQGDVTAKLSTIVHDRH